MNTTKLMSTFTLIGLLAFTSCKENKEKGQNEKSEKLEIQNEQNEEPSVAKGIEDTKVKTDNINLETLPASVGEYVSANYAGYKMVSAIKDPLCTGEEAIDVTIEKQGSTPYSLIFKIDGQFVQQEIDVDISSAPKPVIDNLKSNFAEFKPSQQIEKLTLADKKVQYLVDIAKGNITKEVIFNADGSVACISK